MDLGSGCFTGIHSLCETEEKALKVAVKGDNSMRQHILVIAALIIERGARLRWQSQPRQLGGLTRLRGCRAEKYYGQVSAGIEIEFSVSH